MPKLFTGWRIAVLLGGLALLHRGWLAATALYVSEDAGTVGLMALDILEGARPVFLYGFPYSGALLAYLVAGSFALFGVSTVSFVLPTLLLTAGWAVVTWRLVRDLYGPAAGLAAGLTVIAADWITSWYTMIQDCSYSPLFVLGTLALWLTVRTTRPDRSAAAVEIALLGLVAGLGLWVHPLMAVYLGAALPFHLVRVVRDPSLRRIGAYGAGGFLMVLCLVPYLFPREEEVKGPASLWSLSPETLAAHTRSLIMEQLPDLWTWPSVSGGVFASVPWLLLGAGAVVLLLSVVTAPRGKRLRQLAPGLVLIAFLIFFLPHRQAAAGALRYLIPLVSLLYLLVFAVPLSSSRRTIRLATVTVTGLWVGFQTVQAVRFGVAMQPVSRAHAADHRELVILASDASVETVVLVGEIPLTSMACMLRYTSRDRIRFVAAHTERDHDAFLDAEEDPRPAFACGRGEADLLLATLDRLGATYEVTEGRAFTLVHAVTLPTHGTGAVSREALGITAGRVLEGAGQAVLDRDPTTGVRGSVGIKSHLVIDLGGPTIPALLQVWGQPDPAPPAPDTVPLPRTDRVTGGLPGAVRVDGSLDGERWFVLVEPGEGYPVGYRAGPRVFLDSGFPRQDIALPARPVRFLRYRPVWSRLGGMLWRVSEVAVLTDPQPGPIEGNAVADEVAAVAVDLGVGRLVADRWLSAAVARRTGIAVIRPPHRHLHINNPSYRDPIPAFVPGSNVLVAVQAGHGREANVTLSPGNGASPTRRSGPSGIYELIFPSPSEESRAPRYWLDTLPGRTIHKDI